MSEVERFDFDDSKCCCSAQQVFKPDGEFVYASDYARVVAERDALVAALARLNSHNVAIAIVRSSAGMCIAVNDNAMCGPWQSPGTTLVEWEVPGSAVADALGLKSAIDSAIASRGGE